MKTRRFAIAFERGRVGERSAQAWGFVSRTMTRSDGAASGCLLALDLSYNQTASDVEGLRTIC